MTAEEKETVSFGQFHDILARNVQPTVTARTHHQHPPGRITADRTGVVVHPHDAKRLEAVSAAAGWQVEWE